MVHRFAFTSIVMLFCLAPTSAQSQDRDKVLEELKQVVDNIQTVNADMRAKLEELQSHQATVAAQPEGQDKVVEEFKRALDHIQAVNAEVRAMLEELQSHQVPMAAEVTPDATTRSSLRKLSELKNTLEKVQVEKEIMAAANAEQMKMLEVQLAHVKAVQSNLEGEHDTYSASLATSQVMANRLAEAQVENRLSLLEARAMVEVLKNHRQELSAKNSRMAKLAIEKSHVLLQRRLAELQKISSALNEAQDQELRQQLELETAEAETKVREAELMREEAELHLTSGNRETDERLVEATIQLAVSQAVEQALAEEADRVRQLLAAGNEFEQLQSQRKNLQLQMMDLKRAANQQQAELKSSRLGLESELQHIQQDALLQLELQRAELLKVLGTDHPRVKAIEKEVQILQDHVSKLQQAMEQSK